MITRRSFLKAVALAAAGTQTGLLCLSRWVRARGIYVLRPRPGVRYAQADANHLRYKCYPSRRAAIERLPHRGMSFRVVRRNVDLGGASREALFAGRKDLDFRVRADRRHLARLGVDIKQLEDALT